MRSTLRASLPALALTAVVALAGCTAAPDGATASGAPAAADADLVIWANGPFVQALQPIADEWGEANGISVQVQTVATDLQTNFVTANTSGNGPDIVVGAHDWIGNLVQNGAIDPMLIPDPVRDDLTPIALDAVTLGGQTWGMPYAVESLILIRNAALTDVEPETLDEALEEGQRLVDAGEADRALIQQVGAEGDAYFMQPVYSAAGGYLFGETDDGRLDPQDVGVGQEGSVAAAERIAELAASGVYTQSIDSTNAIQLFLEGRTPYMINGPWTLGELRTAELDYAIQPIPGFDGGDDARPFTGVNSFYVASNATNTAYAQSFVQSVATAPETQAAIAEAVGVPPALESVIADLEGSSPDLPIAFEAASAGLPMPAIPEMAAVWAPLGQAEAAIVGGADPGSTMESAGETIREAIR